MKVRIYEVSSFESCASIQFETAFYYHITGENFQMDRQTVYVYGDEGNELRTVNDYTYDGNGQIKTMKQSHREFSDPTDFNSTRSDYTMTHYSYPYDLASPGSIYEEMSNRNINSVPIEISTTKDFKKVSKVRNEYGLFGSSIYPEKVYVQTGNNPEELRLQYYAYDSHGNPLEFSKADDARVSILWDLEGIRPIAKVVNANRNQIWHTSFEGTGIVSDSKWTGINSKDNGYLFSNLNLPSGEYILSYWQQGVSDEWNFKKEILSDTEINGKRLLGTVDEIRIHPVGSQMSTVTYDNAGRTLTECDPNGHTIRYHYDGFGRLKYIKDEWGNILKGYDYKYHNEY
jgi:YD repeat-containing protein